MSDVTQILQQIERGDPLAAEQLLPLAGLAWAWLLWRRVAAGSGTPA